VCPQRRQKADKTPTVPALSAFEQVLKNSLTIHTPAADGSKIQIEVAPDSKRLQLLTPFAPWDGKDLVELPL
jgi:hypothetical protein